MDYHYHAVLTVTRREEMARTVLGGKSLKSPAADFRLSRQTAAKWVKRYREQGVAGLRDCSSRPRRSPRLTGDELARQVERLRRERWTGVRIAQATRLSREGSGQRLCRQNSLS